MSQESLEIKKSRVFIFFLASYTLWKREVVRFLRQRSRMIASLATPILFWFILGSGIGKSFQTQSDSGTFLDYFLPGSLLLLVLFTSIFSAISIIQDRNEGFLQGIITSPAPRSAIIFGKVLGGATLALFQGGIFYGIALLSGMGGSPGNALCVLGVLVLSALALSSLGFATAWPTDSVQGFHSVMNLLLMPMWLLSGALFPKEGAATWLAFVIEINPLYYALLSLQHFMGTAAPAPDSPSLAFSLCVLSAFTLAMFALCLHLSKKNKTS